MTTTILKTSDFVQTYEMNLVVIKCRFRVGASHRRVLGDGNHDVANLGSDQQ